MTLPFVHGAQVEFYKSVPHKDGTTHRELRTATFLFQEGAYVRLLVRTGKFNHKELNLPASDVKWEPR